MAKRPQYLYVKVKADGTPIWSSHRLKDLMPRKKTSIVRATMAESEGGRMFGMDLRTGVWDHVSGPRVPGVNYRAETQPAPPSYVDKETAYGSTQSLGFQIKVF